MYADMCMYVRVVTRPAFGVTSRIWAILSSVSPLSGTLVVPLFHYSMKCTAKSVRKGTSYKIAPKHAICRPKIRKISWGNPTPN